jgi:hypothetical protein
MSGSMDGLRLATAIRERWPPVYPIVVTGELRPVGTRVRKTCPGLFAAYSRPGIRNIS